jgi:hypothetical protein
MMQRKLLFLARVSKTTIAYQQAKGGGEWVVLDFEGACYKVRVIKVKLDSGEIETLLTNVDEQTLPCNQAGELYFKRWRIEVKLEELKTKLALERMRGKREVTVLQDFYATIWLTNLGAAIRWRTDAMIKDADTHNPHKYQRKTDVNRLLTKLRNQFYLLYNAKTVEQRRAMLDALAADIARYPVDVKPGRFAPRNLAAVPRPCDMKNCSGL